MGTQTAVTLDDCLVAMPAADGEYTLTTSSLYDTIVSIQDSNGYQIGFNDDGGMERGIDVNARIEALALFADGIYTVCVEGFGGGWTGGSASVLLQSANMSSSGDYTYDINSTSYSNSQADGAQHFVST